VEIRGDSSEDGFVTRLLLRPKLADQLLEVGARGGDVVELRAQRLEPLFQLAAFGAGQSVRRADLCEAALQRTHLPFTTLSAGNLLRRDAVRHARADLLHARLQQLSLSRDELEVSLERAGLQPRVDPRLFKRDEAAASFVVSVNGGNMTVPTILFSDGTAMTNPSAAQVKERLRGLAANL